MAILELFRLNGKTALVTGAGRGLGVAMAQGLAEAGADVVLADLNVDGAREAAAHIAASTGRKARGIALDVGDAKAVEACAAELNAEQPIDILVNNAGIVYQKQGDLGPGSIPTELVEPENWDLVIKIDLNSVFYCTQSFGRHMMKRKSGNIISMSSMSAQVGNFGRHNNAYCAAKAGVTMFTRQLAADWACHNIRLNAIAPGYMNTIMGRRSLDAPDVKEFIKTMTPLGRPGEPEELQGLVVFLASEASSYITGQTITIDGGYTLW